MLLSEDAARDISMAHLKEFNMGKILGVFAVVAFSCSICSGQIITLQSQAEFAHADPEINAFDSSTQRTFVTKASSTELDVLSAGFTLDSSIDVSSDDAAIGELNSVAVGNGVVAVAGKAVVGTDPGRIAFYRASDLSYLGSVGVGANPDMVTFAGNDKVLVANEGEPNANYDIDPVGSVSIIDISGGVGGATVATAGFSSFNGSASSINSSGGRIFGPGASVAQDVEPEYIAVSDDLSKAYISLQENNAIAELDLATNTITEIRGLGFKDHSLPGNGLDASNEDGIAGNIVNHSVLGMYQPDAIAFYSVGGSNYLVSANEGDAREYEGIPGFVEETRIADLALDLNDNGIDDDLDDNGVLDNSLAIYDDDAILGRLKTTTATGDTDGDGLIEEIYSYGARSFSIWDADTGAQVFDSGDDFESIIATAFGSEFAENRSDDKGPEPESVVIGEVGGKTLAFIGLERTGGIMIYDISDPNNPVFESFATLSEFGISSPEGLTFVSASDSQFGAPTLLVSNEAGAETKTFAFTIVAVPEPSALALFTIAGLGLISRRNRM